MQIPQDDEIAQTIPSSILACHVFFLDGMFDDDGSTEPLPNRTISEVGVEYSRIFGGVGWLAITHRIHVWYIYLHLP